MKHFNKFKKLIQRDIIRKNMAGILTKEELQRLRENNISEKQISFLNEYLTEHRTINNLNEIVGDNKKIGKLFFATLKHYGYLMDNDANIAVPKSGFRIRRMIFPFLSRIVPVLSYSKIIRENRNILLNKYDTNEEVIPDDGPLLTEEPVIIACNHHLRDDIINVISAAPRPFYIFWGSLPVLFNTIDGVSSYINGVIVVNRNNKHSRKTAVEKAKKVLEEYKTDLLIYPEGCWNKTPSSPLIDFWPGVYTIAKETGAKVLPVINYVGDITQNKKVKKNNPVHIVVDDPIDISLYDQEEGIQVLRDKIATWYWLMMEKYGKTTRSELLKSYNCDDTLKIWEYVLEESEKNIIAIDSKAERNAVFKKKNIINSKDVFEPISKLSLTKSNIIEVINAKKIVDSETRNDFQNRLI